MNLRRADTRAKPATSRCKCSVAAHGCRGLEALIVRFLAARSNFGRVANCAQINSISPPVAPCVSVDRRLHRPRYSRWRCSNTRGGSRA